MTSIPASRRARAMIFAPRSWPSSPGLATTTRILRPPAEPVAAVSVLASTGGTLEDRGLRVGAEHPLERLDDLALAGVCASTVEQRIHEVAVGGGRLAERGERALDR